MPQPIDPAISAHLAQIMSRLLQRPRYPIRLRIDDANGSHLELTLSRHETLTVGKASADLGDWQPRDRDRPERGDTFAWVYWPGAGRYFFNTDGQRAIVQELWAAWENGEHEVEEGELLRRAGYQSDRVKDAMKRNPAWEALIVRGARPGTLRLVPLPADG